MISKKWWQSKQVWLGVLIVAVGIVEYLASVPAGASIFTMIGGCLTIIVRFLTNTAIAGTPGAKVK